MARKLRAPQNRPSRDAASRGSPRAPGSGESTLADVALVEALGACENDAYVELIRRHGPAMERTVHRYLAEPAAAQDAVEDAYVSVFRHVRQFRGTSRFGTWLHSVAANSALMQRRSRARHPAVPLSQVPPSVLEPARSSDGASPLDRFAEREDRESLRALVDRLPGPTRTVVTLRFFHGITVRGTAGLLGIGVRTAKMRQSRGLRALRDLLSSSRGAAPPTEGPAPRDRRGDDPCRTPR